jgi:hypothetical protein
VSTAADTATHPLEPDALLRAGAQLQTVNAVVRNIRLQRDRFKGLAMPASLTLPIPRQSSFVVMSGPAPEIGSDRRAGKWGVTRHNENY